MALTPVSESSAAGRIPGGRWDVGLNVTMVFLGPDTSQYYPDLTSDNRSVRPPEKRLKKVTT